jgi:hypothetical protein
MHLKEKLKSCIFFSLSFFRCCFWYRSCLFECEMHSDWNTIFPQEQSLHKTAKKGNKEKFPFFDLCVLFFVFRRSVFRFEIYVNKEEGFCSSVIRHVIDKFSIENDIFSQICIRKCTRGNRWASYICMIVIEIHDGIFLCVIESFQFLFFFFIFFIWMAQQYQIQKIFHISLENINIHVVIDKQKIAQTSIVVACQTIRGHSVWGSWKVTPIHEWSTL